MAPPAGTVPRRRPLRMSRAQRALGHLGVQGQSGRVRLAGARCRGHCGGRPLRPSSPSVGRSSPPDDFVALAGAVLTLACGGPEGSGRRSKSARAWRGRCGTPETRAGGSAAPMAGLEERRRLQPALAQQAALLRERLVAIHILQRPVAKATPQVPIFMPGEWPCKAPRRSGRRPLRPDGRRQRPPRARRSGPCLRHPARARQCAS